jgi:hypothetical protein
MNRFQALSYVRKNEGEYIIKGKCLFESKEHLCQITMEKGMIKGVTPFSISTLTQESIEYVTKATMYLHILEHADTKNWETISYNYLVDEEKHICQFQYKLQNENIIIYFKEIHKPTNDIEWILYFDFPVGNKTGRIYVNEDNVKNIKTLQETLRKKERIRLMMLPRSVEKEPK